MENENIPEEEYYEPVYIIEKTDEAQIEFGRHLWGNNCYKISRKHIQALLDGKCLAARVCDEYAMFIELDEEN